MVLVVFNLSGRSQRVFFLRGLHLIASVCVLVSHKAAVSARFADDTQLYLSFNPNSPTDQVKAWKP